MVKNDGRPTAGLLQSIPWHGPIMSAPMMMRGTAVADRGTAHRNGEKGAEAKKSTAMTNEESPVRAPSIIVAPLSFATITGLVPKSAPTIVPNPTLVNTPRSFRSSAARPAAECKPCWTPATSKRHTRSMTRAPSVSAGNSGLPGTHPEKSMYIKASVDGIAKTLLGGGFKPLAQLTVAINIMPASSAPRTRATTNAVISPRPPRAKTSRKSADPRSPMATSVSGDPTTRPIAWNPMSACNMPIEAVIAFLRCSDKRLRMMRSQMPKTARRTSTAPLTKQQLSAFGHEIPKALQIPYVK
mmetsp:Transcript_731/g.1564  ORF Transcript_731/g.1564 Transcript_731/m.1564 type:complete len:299 (+) Transcript_731:612-1508(+)